MFSTPLPPPIPHFIILKNQDEEKLDSTWCIISRLDGEMREEKERKMRVTETDEGVLESVVLVEWEYMIVLVYTIWDF